MFAQTINYRVFSLSEAVNINALLFRVFRAPFLYSLSFNFCAEETSYTGTGHVISPLSVRGDRISFNPEIEIIAHFGRGVLVTIAN